MSTTNFTRLTTEQLTVWARDLWKNARNASFLTNFVGSGADSMIQRITELRRDSKGARAVLTLVPDSEGDGVVGDNQLKGNESELSAEDQVIQIDQWRDAHVREGRMAEQKSIVRFREEARDKLAYTAADRIDQMAFLALSGVSFTLRPTGVPRVGSQLPDIAFAADVTPPSAGRHIRWSAATGIESGDTSSVVPADTPSWAMLVEAKAFAVDNFLKPIRTAEGIQVYNVFLTPQGMAKLKQDPQFLAAWQNAQKRGDDNPLFKGTPHGGTKGIFIDGLNIMEFRHVFNTSRAPNGSKWGSAGDVNGQRILFCGAQALGYADIGNPIWVEDDDDYGNRMGISVAKIIGMKKPVFRSVTTGAPEDFGVIALDTAI